MSTYQQIQGIATAPGIMGTSDHAHRMRDFALKAATIDATVLLEGETGVGKDLMAETIHYLGRSNKPLVPVLCGNLQETVFESELFGHAKGAYTDASEKKVGWIQLAERGTLFVDEIGDLTPALQVKFLRVLDKKSYWVLGGTEQRVDTRIVAATNKNLADEVRAGRFRQDLFGRLNVLRFKIMPLRDRREDIPHLVRYFLSTDDPTRSMSPEAMRALMEYDWPENVREVRNVVKKILFSTPANRTEIRPEDAEPYLTGSISVNIPGGHDEATRERLQFMLDRMLLRGESFWEAVHQPFMERDISRSDVRAIVGEGIKLVHGHYKALVTTFNMPESDYKRFLNFLRKHRCQLPFQNYRN